MTGSRIDPAAREVLEELENQVRDRLGGQVRGFQLDFRDGGLVLRGRTRTYYAKQCVQHLVMAATDLPIAANDVEVT
jgi:hypothetical protein